MGLSGGLYHSWGRDIFLTRKPLALAAGIAATITGSLFAFNNVYAANLNLANTLVAQKVKPSLTVEILKEFQLNGSPVEELLQNKLVSFEKTQVESSHGTESTRFTQTYKDLPVVGSQVILHESKGKKTGTTNAFAFDLDVKPSLTSNEVQELVFDLNPKYRTDFHFETQPVLSVLPNPEQKTAQLIYMTTLLPNKNLNSGNGANGNNEENRVSPRTIWVNAHSGQVLVDVTEELSFQAPSVSIDVYSGKSQEMNPELVDEKTGNPKTLNASIFQLVIQNLQTVDPSLHDETAQRAARNATATARYYSAVHGRNSFDGVGSPIVSLVHAGRNWMNAAWSPRDKVMAYGDGDGKNLADFTNSGDIAGHEMTHGVVSNTARFVGFGESGALNEAFADFFGKMIENKNDWVIGRGIFLDPRRSAVGIRNLANPKAVPYLYRDLNGQPVRTTYPAHYNERFVPASMCGEKNDSCYVHANSTVFSHAAYRIFSVLGKAKSEKLLYVSMTQFMTPISGFRDGALGTIAACEHVLDDASCATVKAAFESVGL
jgi:Zn-dependent metalloprotease